MQNQSPRFTLNATDKKVILSVIVHGIIGIFLTLISEVFMKLNYGIYAPMVTMGLSTISAFLTNYLDGPSAQELRIKQLEQVLAQQQQQNPPVQQ